ncbi:retrovirus-related pol polyprotein from transposon TNT 1-94 [Tanacetum coccineum]
MKVIGTEEHIEGTEEPNEGTDGQDEGTEEHIGGTEENFEGTKEYKKGTEEQVESTDGHKKGTKEEIATQATQTSTQTPTSIVFGDDETIAKVLLNMSKAKAVSREKEKGVELKDIEEADRPKPTSTRSLLTLKPLPKIDPKDKGKKKIEEEDESESESDGIPEAEKKFKQLESDEEMARKMQEEWEGEEERSRIAEEKAANEALIRNFDDIKARIEADRLLAEKLQEQEREQFTIEERAKFLHDTIAAQRKFLAQQRSEAIRNRPPTKNQLRNQMMTYHAELKIKKFEEVQALYEKIKRSDEDFISIGSAEDERLIKRMNEKGVDSSKGEMIKEESKAEVEEESKEEENKKKRKLGTRKKMKSRKRRYIQNTSEDDSDKENDELRLHLTIAPDEEKEVDYEILDRKYPIKEWKTECLGTKPQTDQAEHLEEINLNVVIRSNGQKRYFSTLMSVLSIFDREDLDAVYQLVMDRFQDEIPEGFDRVLWGDLMVMFNPDDENEFWNSQQDWKIVSWKLHSSSGVHTLVTETELVIHMLVEKKYPLRKEVLMQMLKLKLESEEDSTMALELIKFVKKILAELEPEEHKNWAVHKAKRLGGRTSQICFAGNLPKNCRFSTHLASCGEGLASSMIKQFMGLTLITPPSESASEEDSDPEQAQKDKYMQKNLALIAKYMKDNKTGQFRESKAVNVVGLGKLEGKATGHERRDDEQGWKHITVLHGKDSGGFLCSTQAQELSHWKRDNTILTMECNVLSQWTYNILSNLNPLVNHMCCDKQEREQYLEIQDLKAQLQDKNIAISELKKLIDKCKGKSVDTKFYKPSVVRQPNAQRIPKPSVLGKPAPFSNSLERTNFAKKKSVSNTNESEGMYRIVSNTTQTRAPQLNQTSRNTNPRLSTSTGVAHKTNVCRPQPRSNQTKDKVVPNNSHVKFKKTEVEEHPRISKFKNRDVIEFCGSKGIKREYSNARTPQQNGVAERKNRTLIEAGDSDKEDESAQDCFVLPIWPSYSSTNTPALTTDDKREGPREEEQVFMDDLERLKRQEKEANEEAEVLRKKFEHLVIKEGAAKPSILNDGLSLSDLTKPEEDDSEIPPLEDIYQNSTDGIFTTSSYDDEGAVADFTNLETVVNVSPIPTLRIHSTHPKALILGDPNSAVQTRSKVNTSSRAHAFVAMCTKQKRTNHKDLHHCFYLLVSFLNMNPRIFQKLMKDEKLVDAIARRIDAVSRYRKYWVLVYCLMGRRQIHAVDLIHESRTYMVAYLEKSEGNAEFHEIVDFLKRISIHHALTCTGQIAGKSVSISEATIKVIFFDDADGIDSLPNQAIFDAIQLMGTEDVHSNCKEGVSTDMEKVSTDRPIVSTDGSKVSIDRQVEGTEEHNKGTEEHNEGTEEKNEGTKENFEGTEEHIEGTKEQVESTDGHKKGTEEEILLTHSNIHSTPTTIHLIDDKQYQDLGLLLLRSLLTLKPLLKIDPKDKRKKKIEEEHESESESDGIPEAEKKFKQLESDEEIGLGNKEKTLMRKKARIEADRLLAEKLQEQEREQFIIEERAKFFHDTIAAQRRFLAQQRSEAINNKPPTKNQLRKSK